ncbi:oocyte-secreted protein 3-like [Crocuta crocuta]
MKEEMARQNSRVLVECSRLKFFAVVKRALFYRDELVGPDELFLGTGCETTRVRPDELEFNYPISLCGIVTQVFYDGVAFHSWLIYVPKNKSISAKLHLECTVPSSCTSPDESRNNAKVSNDGFLISPPVQQWLLIHYRYCRRCGYAHFREHWSRPFYGSHNYSLQEYFSHPFTDDF